MSLYERYCVETLPGQACALCPEIDNAAVALVYTPTTGRIAGQEWRSHICTYCLAKIEAFLAPNQDEIPTVRITVPEIKKPSEPSD